MMQWNWPMALLATTRFAGAFPHPPLTATAGMTLRSFGNHRLPHFQNTEGEAVLPHCSTDDNFALEPNVVLECCMHDRSRGTSLVSDLKDVSCYTLCSQFVGDKFFDAEADSEDLDQQENTEQIKSKVTRDLNGVNQDLESCIDSCRSVLEPLGRAHYCESECVTENEGDNKSKENDVDAEGDKEHENDSEDTADDIHNEIVKETRAEAPDVSKHSGIIEPVQNQAPRVIHLPDRQAMNFCNRKCWNAMPSMPCKFKCYDEEEKKKKKKKANTPKLVPFNYGPSKAQPPMIDPSLIPVDPKEGQNNELSQDLSCHDQCKNDSRCFSKCMEVEQIHSPDGEEAGEDSGEDVSLEHIENPAEFVKHSPAKHI